MKITKKLAFVLIVPVMFFLISFFTLSDYGISWDEPIHFFRGEAYLHYFLTGETHYPSLKTLTRPSYYQDLSQNAEFFMENDSGHPPLNGITAALFNYIFYQKLNILPDIESFHLFNVVSTTLLVVVVSVFMYQRFGVFPALITGIVASSYPLLFSEGHFNIKDPPEAAFYAVTIWAFWNSIRLRSWKWLLLSIVFCGIALGTKFNILFLPFILIPWLLSIYHKDILKPIGFVKSWPKKYLVLLLLAPLIVFVIFFGTWPYLWQNPLTNLDNIIFYYKDIGTGVSDQPKYLLPGGFNAFPIYWIIITTPPYVLILLLIGILSILFLKKDKYKTSILWLLWFLVPILRVTAPKASVYGGIRQIMEFIPALALLSGLGAYFLIRKFNHKFIKYLILLAFVPHLIVMINLHPNENVYFNFLVGGLYGAKEKNIPYWGNSFGNAYYQAVEWLNKNAPEGSKLALVQGTATNIPTLYLNSNINYSNSYWSGFNRYGEYLVDLTHQGYKIAYPFVWDYLDNVLIPVYEVQVDGVAIARIWKNDFENSKPKYQSEEINLKIVDEKKSQRELVIEFDKIYSLARLEAAFKNDNSCKAPTDGTIFISVDGKNWQRQEETLATEQVIYFNALNGEKINYLFAGREAKYLKISVNDDNSCLFNRLNYAVKGY